MANTAEGLSQGPAEEVDPNSAAGFAKLMESRGVEPDEGDTSLDTSVASGLTTVEPDEQPRGPDGKFIPKETPTEPAEDTSTEQEQFSDPALTAYLDKYQGDVGKALKAAVEAQALIGRRDEEREELRERLARLEGALEARAEQAPPAQALSDDQVFEQAANLVQSKGHLGAATDAANHSLESGDERLLKAVYEQWQYEDTWEANNFLADFRAFQRTQSVQASAPDPWVEGRKANEGIAATLGTLKGELGAETFNQLVAVDESNNSLLTKALDTMPKAVAALISSDDPEERLEGTRLVADRALRLSGGVVASQATDTVEPEVPASVQRKLAGAGVATAGLRPTPAKPDTPQSVEDATADFKRQILEAETTSVASGLTFGPQPAR